MKDITGHRFGRLIALKIAGKAHNRFRWECKCDCGQITVTDGNALRTGKTQSCGCLNSDLRRARLLTHGKTDTRTYRTWASMWSRCTNEKEKAYKNYGGRGIRVCDRWQSFEMFLRDMGERPEGSSIERKDVNGNYEPSNCKWATAKEQHANKRNTIKLSFNGETHTQAEWGRILGFEQRLIGHRLGLGWTVEKALTLPPLPRGKRS